MSRCMSLMRFRRSYYGLKAESTIDDERLLELVQTSVKHTPSSFNNQSGRVVLVLKGKHTELWDAVLREYNKLLDGNGGRVSDNERQLY